MPVTGPASGAVAAVDLGASSGRVVLGRLGGGRVDISVVHRFANDPVELVDGLHWNIAELYRNVLLGLGMACREASGIVGVAVDSWAVDYALLRGDRMLGLPFHYRDDRNEAGVAAVRRRVVAEELYARNGLQHLPFNTVFQLATEGESLRAASSLLLIPDLITFWLSGEKIAEATNASTTGLLDVRIGAWDEDLISRLAFPRGLFQPIAEPGTIVGSLRVPVVDQIGSGGRIAVGTVGSHDTASAVVGAPMLTDDAAYISCGTWGLVGLELTSPVLSEESRRANFTNERGVDGRVRYLRNVMGLWLLSESIRWWERAGETIDLGDVLGQAAAVDEPVPVFDVDHPDLLAPGDLPGRIAQLLADSGQAGPQTIAQTVRCIVESLARAFATTLDEAERLCGRGIGIVHLVGGGARNALLCQLTADHAARTVLAGPVEATALGNVMVQARTHGLVSGGLESLRSIIASSSPPTMYHPRPVREPLR